MDKDLSGDLSGLPETGRVVVGFSGGADSTALAHWLTGKVSPSRLVLAHVNHMLRGKESDRDEAAAREFAQSLGLRFAVFKADVGELAQQRGVGLEECGREIRYDFFASLAEDENDRILTAHNANDNAETMLWNLCRGTGLSGLCGIPYRRGKVLRPFLRVSREEIEAYCAAQGLSYVTDSTNLTGDFSRNRIRREVLPVLRALNPQAVSALSRTASLLKRDRDFLRGEAEKLLAQAQRPYGLDAKTLERSPAALRALALRLWLERQGFFHGEKQHLDQLDQLLTQGGAVPLPGGSLVRCAGGLVFLDRKEEWEPFSVPVSLGKTSLPGGKTLILEKKPVFLRKSTQKIHNLDFKNALDYDIISAILGDPVCLTARTRQAGDRFSPPGRGLSKPLKQVFAELGVPAGRRGGAVLLECGSRLAFCEGAGAAEGFQVTEKTVTALVVTVREKENKG